MNNNVYRMAVHSGLALSAVFGLAQISPAAADLYIGLSRVFLGIGVISFVGLKIVSAAFEREDRLMAAQHRQYQPRFTPVP